MTKYYTGIGSRELPKSFQPILKKIAIELSKKRYVLRSGGAIGADQAFESGAGTNKIIYIPWDSFEGRYNNINSATTEGYIEEAMTLVKDIHPNWNACSQGAKKLHGRNAFQILGSYLDEPTEFVLFYAPEENGIVKGGTATAVHLARKLNIPTVNLAVQKNLEGILNKLNINFTKT